MRLECGPCVIRSWQHSDLESLVRHANNRKVWINLRDRFPHPYTTADGEFWLGHATTQQHETNFAIDVDGEAVGGISYGIGRDVERCEAELGYWLGEDYWGRGIATAALKTFADHIFTTTDLARLFATPFCENMASRRVLVKAGFQLEGTLRQSAIKDGRLIDKAIYARLRNSPDAEFF
jgi:RimJ/RimL family protein N-acetyltransferase